ncbi:TetR/AcrR family transcriptional regulator [Devosia riboflavina]
MRVSKRDLILASIRTIVERDGITALTFDAVAAETGITRGGILYHFPSREALVRAANEFAANGWEASLSEKLGKDRDEASAAERLIAYVKVAAVSVDRSDLALIMESATDPTMGGFWLETYDRWVEASPDPNDDASMLAFIARLAADGLWLHDALLSRPLPEATKTQVIERLVAMISRTA